MVVPGRDPIAVLHGLGSCLTADLVAVAGVWRAFYNEQMGLHKNFKHKSALPCPLALLPYIADDTGATLEGLTILADLPLCVNVNVGILAGALHKALRALTCPTLQLVANCEAMTGDSGVMKSEATLATKDWLARQVKA